MLLYTVAIGSLYRAQAALMIKSFRQNGFGGSIVAIGDKEVVGADHTFMITKEWLQRRGYGPQFARASLLEFMTPPGYTLYCNADVRCTRPINIDTNKVGAHRSRINGLIYSSKLTKADVQRMKRDQRAAHSGVVGFPDADFLKLWEYEIKGMRLDCAYALNVVLLRNYPNWIELPVSWAGENIDTPILNGVRVPIQRPPEEEPDEWDIKLISTSNCCGGGYVKPE